MNFLEHLMWFFYLWFYASDHGIDETFLPGEISAPVMVVHARGYPAPSCSDTVMVSGRIPGLIVPTPWPGYARRFREEQE